MSMSIHATVQSSQRYTEFVDFRNLRRFDDWCRTLGVTRHQLVNAVAAVGENAQAVRLYLKRRCG
jgi:hypothetical protein